MVHNDNTRSLMVLKPHNYLMDGETNIQNAAQVEKEVVPSPSSKKSTLQVNINIQNSYKATVHSTMPQIARKCSPLSGHHSALMINFIIAIMVWSMIALLELGVIPTRQVGFFCKDLRISFKHSGDTITPATLLVGSGTLPAVALILTEVFPRRERAVRTILLFYKEYLAGATLTILFTALIKSILGEHRPDFIDICKPLENQNCTNGTFIEAYTCSNLQYTKYFLMDASRSFPSGHSSLSVYVSIFCAYIIQTRLPANITGSLIRPLLIAVFFIWGIICSLTRITDGRHHWWDVASGIILGSCSSFYAIWMIQRNATQRSYSNSINTFQNVSDKNPEME